jgi:Na+-transporting methylmalonyl-CoA/oxaloacetate decarboxylase gamma subunit
MIIHGYGYGLGMGYVWMIGLTIFAAFIWGMVKINQRFRRH